MLWAFCYFDVTHHFSSQFQLVCEKIHGAYATAVSSCLDDAKFQQKQQFEKVHLQAFYYAWCLSIYCHELNWEQQNLFLVGFV
jgi:hypothetical protein